MSSSDNNNYSIHLFVEEFMAKNLLNHDKVLFKRFLEILKLTSTEFFKFILPIYTSIESEQEYLNSLDIEQNPIIRHCSSLQLNEEESNELFKIIERLNPQFINITGEYFKQYLGLQSELKHYIYAYDTNKKMLDLIGQEKYLNSTLLKNLKSKIQDIRSEIEILNPKKKLDRKFTKEEPKIRQKEKIKNSTLEEIWIGKNKDEKSNYNEVISILKKDNLFLDRAFIIKQDNLLQWLKLPNKGWQQYLSAFILTCIKKKWIRSDYSAPELVSIISNTFHVTTHKNNIPLSINSIPKDKYLTPIESLLKDI